jgi:type II secretory pathway component PulK
MNNLEKKFNKRGAALIFVIAAMLVASIMIATVAQLAQSNVKQAGAQEKSMQAYYIARSGAEIAYEGMYQKGYIGPTGTLITSNSLTQQVLTLGDGTATINVTASGTASARMFTIVSVGKLTNSNVSKTVQLIGFVDYTNKNIQWK